MPDIALAETLSRLYRLRSFEIKFGLEMEQAILNRLGNPERCWKSIHVAGTNGKGSVCAMLESVLRTAGLKTGLFTSPHLIHFNERIRVNGQCITDDELADVIRYVEHTAQAISHEPGGREATFFELATALGFEYFKRKQVDIAILETGMGGRLDATNVVTPLLSIITDISIEHTAWLGKDIASIAREKCGIIKPGRPVIIGRLPQEAFDVVSRTACERHSRLIQADQTVSVQRQTQNLEGRKIRIESSANSYGTLTLSLLGTKTPENAAVAVAALEELATITSLDIRASTVKKGLERVHWPGRFQILSRQPLVIVDGAHNPGAAECLVRSIRELLKHIPIGLVFGIASDKDMTGFLRPFADLVKNFWAVPIRSERSLPTSEIAARARALGWPVLETTVPLALEQATAWARESGGAVCIAGSLFLAGEVLELKYGTGGLF